MTEVAHLTHNGSSKYLVRGCRYVYPGEVYECSVEEAETRIEQDPGLWNRVDAPEVEEVPAEEVKTLEAEKTPAKTEVKTPETEDKVEVKEAPAKTAVKKSTPIKKVGDKIQK